MQHDVKQYRVLIHSASDTKQEARVVAEAVAAWNAGRTDSDPIRLIPLALGSNNLDGTYVCDRHVDIKQMVSACDLIVAVCNQQPLDQALADIPTDFVELSHPGDYMLFRFWARIGTSEDRDSEIERVRDEFYELTHELHHLTGLALALQPGVEKGAYGYRVGPDKDGNRVEWIPFEDNPGEEYASVLGRGQKAIQREYEEYSQKVWWTRHQQWLYRLAHGETLTEAQKPIYERAIKEALRIERRYGKRHLMHMTEFEIGMIHGKLSAFGWILGKEWEGSLDT